MCVCRPGSGLPPWPNTPSEGPRVSVAASEGHAVSVSATQPCSRGKRDTDGEGAAGLCPRDSVLRVGSGSLLQPGQASPPVTLSH